MDAQRPGTVVAVTRSNHVTQLTVPQADRTVQDGRRHAQAGVAMMTGAPQIATSEVGRRHAWGNAAALAVLVVAAVTALRGRLPELGPRAAQQSTGSNSVTLAGLLILLSVSMLVTAIALLTRPPRIERPTAPEERRFPGGSGVWSLRRLLILGVGVAMAVLLAVLIGDQLRELTLPAVTVSSDTESESAPEMTAPPSVPAPGPDGNSAADDPVFGYLTATVIAMAVLMVASAVLARRRGRVLAPTGNALDGSAPDRAEPLALAAERGLAAVEDPSRNPREAIIACYLAMEQVLFGTPGAMPLESDTPSEVLARAVGNRALRADSAAPLVRVFAEARFSTHTMTEDHREVAEQALRAVLTDVRSGS